MLPECFIDSYKRYKADTRTIATWLIEGAETSGFTNTNNTIQPYHTVVNQQAKVKLKGRARKLARDAANAEQKMREKKPPPPQQYVVKTKDFVPMAIAIASSRPPKIKPSTTILEVFRRTIAARKSCAMWYATGSDGNEGHQHFINVLQEALSILKPLAPKEQVDKIRTKHVQITHKKFPENRFSNLVLEDADESTGEDVTQPTSNPSLPKPPTPDVIYEQDDTENEEEFRFASYCLIKDLNDLRQYLLGLWQRYRRKEIDLAVAAATTNMAINLVRRSEREFARTATWPKEYAAKWQGSPIAGCIPVVVVSNTEDDGKDSMLRSGWSATYNVASIRPPQGISEDREEWTFFRAWLLLQCCDGPFPAHYSKVTNDPFVQDVILLRSITLGIAAIARHCGQMNFMDELSCGLAAYMGLATDTSPPLWLIFATQILVDTHRVLASSLSGQMSGLSSPDRVHATSPSSGHRHLIEARLAYEYLQITFDKHYEIHESWPESLQRPSVIDDMRQVVEDFGYFFSAELAGKIELRMKICAARRQRGVAPEASSDPFDLLESNPTLCGMIRYYCFLELQRFGSDWANITRSIWSATHLYNALSVKDIDMTKTRKGPQMSRREAAEAKLARDDAEEVSGASLIPNFPVWADIDLVMSHHGEERILVGGKPKTLEEAMKKWYLAQGYSASTFAKGRRENIPLKLSSKSMRHLRLGSTIAEIFLRRCNHCDCDASMTVQDVEAVLNDRHVQTNRGSGGHSVHESSHCRDDAKGKARDGLTTLKMVETLEEGLIAEMPEILFDYFSMDHRCTQFFLDLAANFKTKKKECWNEDFLSGRMEGITATGCMMPELLRHACDLEKAPGLLPFKACYCINVEPLEIAREKLEELVLAEGSVESDKLSKRVMNNGLAVPGAGMMSRNEETNVGRSGEVKNES